MLRNETPLEFRILPNPWDFGYALNIFMRTKDYVAVAQPIVMETYPFGAKISETPTVSMSSLEIQNLMDELWRTGIRPSSGEGNIGQIGATEKHLNDMRKIVSKQLDVQF